MAQFDFDTTTVEKRENKFELLPAGMYVGQVIESQIAPLQSGNGDGLKLTIEILSDAYRGRKVWTNLNVRHSKEETERWAQQTLRELCDAIGLARMTDTVQLHHKPVGLRIKIREDKTGKFEPQNDVAGFRPVGGSQAHGQAIAAGMAARAPQAPANATAAAAGTSAPPWAKRAA